MKSLLSSASLLSVFLAIPLGAWANVQPNTLFSDGAVLQRDMAVPVWGTADEGEPVTVTFGGQTATTTAKDGKWLVKLTPMPASDKPQTMTIAGKNTVTVSNLLIGEVWVCSGQSNMEWKISNPVTNKEQEIAAANYPLLRQFSVEKNAVDTPAANPRGSWETCTPQTVGKFTAVGYFFGRDLQQTIKVPVGLLLTAWGGTPAQAWTRQEVFATDPVLAGIPAGQAQNIKKYDEQLAKYKMDEPKLLAAYEKAVETAKQSGKPAPRKPALPVNPLNDKNRPSCLYNGMIAPLIPYAIRGAIWYQGESDAGAAKRYQTLFPAMITDWRKQWGQKDFPFLFVQIAPHNGQCPEIREAQLLSWQRTPNTAMAVTTDCGEAGNIHPIHKQPVGARLALAARALAYGEKIEYSGPAFQTMKSDGGRAVLSFTHVGGGLVAKDGALKGFTIAGADKKFVPAEARIEGGTVVVSSPQVAAPAAVRYGWANVPDVNLFNTEGIPASPFRTDPE